MTGSVKQVSLDTSAARQTAAGPSGTGRITGPGSFQVLSVPLHLDKLPAGCACVFGVLSFFWSRAARVRWMLMTFLRSFVALCRSSTDADEQNFSICLTLLQIVLDSALELLGRICGIFRNCFSGFGFALVIGSLN